MKITGLLCREVFAHEYCGCFWTVMTSQSVSHASYVTLSPQLPGQPEGILSMELLEIIGNRARGFPNGPSMA